MFRIKICGVTTAADARLAAAAGADAIGLNFHPGSRRFLPPDAADEVVAAIGPGVLKVGVFVNAPAEFVGRTADRLRLDLIQLSGDESAEFIAELGPRAVINALRPRLESPSEAAAEILRFLDQADRLRSMPKLLLIDAFHPTEFGGTGQSVDWLALSRLWSEIGRAAPPLVLAGGLKPENVRAAVETVRPAGVDVASGVETSPGTKDPRRMRQFVAAALAGFQSASPRPSHPIASDRS